MNRLVFGPAWIWLAWLLVFPFKNISFAGAPSNTEAGRVETTGEITPRSKGKPAPPEIDREGRFMAYTDGTGANKKPACAAPVIMARRGRDGDL